MTNKMMMETMMKQMDAIMNKLDALDNRVSALEQKKVNGTSKPTSRTKKDPELSKFEPKKGDDNQYIWKSYEACRKAWCYTKLGCKVWQGKVTKPKDFTFNKEKWDSANAEFKAAYKYIKKADR